MPAMADPSFSQTVTLICAHSEEGAMGIVINRPLNIGLGEILTQMELQPRDDSIDGMPVYHGGPVQTDRGFVLHQTESKWNSSIHVSDEIEVTTSRDILQSIANGEGPDESLVALGYAGWGAGQLEQEMIDNAWLSSPVNTDIIFKMPSDKRWQSAAAILGINIDNLSSDIGHA